MKKTKNAQIKFDFQPYYILLIAAILMVIILVCLPLGYLFVEAFTASNGSFTFANFTKQLSRKPIITALKNTVLVAAGNCTLSTIFGVILSYGVSRTNMRGKSFLKSTIIITIMTPPFLLTLAYIILVGPNVGYINLIVRKLFRLQTEYGPFNIYSMWSLIILGLPQGIATMFMLVFPAMENMDPYMEEAGWISGSSFFRTAMDVTIPLVKPAILSGVMLVFGQTIAMYGVPKMLNINVLTTKIRESITAMDTKMGAVLSVLVTIFSLGAVFVYRRAIRSTKKYSTISAKGFRPKVIELKKARWIFTGFGIVYTGFSFVLPYGTLLLVSFMKIVGNGFSLSNFTFGNYISLAQTDMAVSAFKNSFLLAVMTSTLVVLIGLLIAFILIRTKLRGRAILEYLCNMPSGISGTALAMGLIFMYLSYPMNKLRFYGTIWILLVAYVTRMLPQGIRYCQSAFIQIHIELEEASRMTGASWSRTMFKVTLPLCKTALAYAWILTFVMAFPELSSSTMLRGMNSDVISTAILDIWDGPGGLPKASAYGMIVFLVVTVMTLVAQKISGKSILDQTNEPK